jgi:hypothetical protein
MGLFSIEYLLKGLLRDRVSRGLFSQQPLGLRITGTGFMGGLGRGLDCFLQSFGGAADLNCIGGGWLRFRCG